MSPTDRATHFLLICGLPWFVFSCPAADDGLTQGTSSSSSDVPDSTDGMTSTMGEADTRATTGEADGAPTTGRGSTSTSSTTETDSTGIPSLPPFDPMCDETPGSGGSDGAGSSGGGGGQPNGSTCAIDQDCNSGHCPLLVGIGGTCGECSADTDCPTGGCTPPGPGVPFAVCNEGTQGSRCEEDDACCGIGICAVVVNFSESTSISTCGQCAEDRDCPNSGLCQPNTDFASNRSGTNECVLPGSLEIGRTCDPDTSGDDACESGHCADVQFGGVVIFGVCSECSDGSDCDGGRCAAPEVTLRNGVVPGICT